MRYPATHKDDTRKKLIRRAASLAKKHGFAASGVDALARAAGLTSGAIYKHFDGKDGLLAAICESEIRATKKRFDAIEPRCAEQVLLAVDAYLSIAHVRAADHGCVVPALSAEISRAHVSTREAFERAFADFLKTVTEKVGDRAMASAIVTQCVGAVTVARALASEHAQKEVLRAAREGARRLLATAC